MPWPTMSRRHQAALKRADVSTEDCDRELQRINLILGLLDVFFPSSNLLSKVWSIRP